MTEPLARGVAALTTFTGLPEPRPKPMTTVTWHSVDLRTGRRGGPIIPRAGSGQAFSRVLNEATETSLEVLIPAADGVYDDWVGATQPHRVMMVAVDQDDRPIWGGMVYRRISSESEWATLNLVTLEAYLDRRYINLDVTYSNADQVSEIAAGVIQTTMADGDGILFTVDAPFSNWRRDRTYLVDDDKTILSILDELGDIDSGIEFTIDLEWTDETNTVLNRIIRIRNRVGTAYLGNFGSESEAPPAVFHMPGSVVGFQYVEDYSSENGANGVVAVSSGEGDTRPESTMHIPVGEVAGFGGSAPLFERRFTPSTSITEQSTLDAHASRELQETWDGLQELTLEANLDVAPQLHVDWWLGDDIGVQLTTRRFPERMSSDGGKVAGYIATLRCIGWEVDLTARLLKPTLVELNEVEVETL